MSNRIRRSVTDRLLADGYDVKRSATSYPYAALHGIRVGTREMFLQMNRAIDANGITPVIDTVVPFESALEAWRLQASGNFVGKIVISLSERPS